MFSSGIDPSQNVSYYDGIEKVDSFGSRDFWWYNDLGATNSNSPHHGAQLTSYKGDPFVAGGRTHLKTERLNWSMEVEPGYWTDPNIGKRCIY